MRSATEPATTILPLASILQDEGHGTPTEINAMQLQPKHLRILATFGGLCAGIALVAVLAPRIRSAELPARVRDAGLCPGPGHPSALGAVVAWRAPARSRKRPLRLRHGGTRPCPKKCPAI